MLVSIDPGAKLAGVAVWEDGELTSAFLTRGKSWHDTAGNVRDYFDTNYPGTFPFADVVIERPQVYHQSKQKGDPNDLITIALMAGATAALLGERGTITTYLPRGWKGSVKKDVMVERIKKKLTPEEHSRVDLPAPSLRHNVYDAIGLGFHHLKRR